MLAAACLWPVAASFCAMYIYTSGLPTGALRGGRLHHAHRRPPLVGSNGVSASAPSVYALATIIAAACAALLPRDPAAQFGPSERTGHASSKSVRQIDRPLLPAATPPEPRTH